MDYPYENLLIKLVDVLAKGIGTGTRPLLIRWEARQKALADADTLRIDRLAQEKLRQDIQQVRAGRASITDDVKLLEHSPGSASSDERKIAELRQQYVEVLQAGNIPPHRLIEIERQINLDQIAVLALEEAQADDDENFSPPFSSRVRASGLRISESSSATKT